MIFREIPQAAGITGILTAAGLGSSEVHEWFHTRRDELVGLTPALALMTIVAPPNIGRIVLSLAQADALELRNHGRLVLGPFDLPRGWEGTD
jgi:hypothetical protein